MSKIFRLKTKCKRCRGDGRDMNRETWKIETCRRCKGAGTTSRKISYAGPVGKRMLAAERRALAYVRQANKEGRLGSCYDRGAETRLVQKGKIVFLHCVRNLCGGWMIAGWRKPLERSYYGEYGTKLWSPVSKKLVSKKA